MRLTEFPTTQLLCCLWLSGLGKCLWPTQEMSRWWTDRRASDACFPAQLSLCVDHCCVEACLPVSKTSELRSRGHYAPCMTGDDLFTMYIMCRVWDQTIVRVRLFFLTRKQNTNKCFCCTFVASSFMTCTDVWQTFIKVGCHVGAWWLTHGGIISIRNHKE